MNPGHVVSECTPTRELIEEYTKAVDEHNSNEETQILKSLDETKKAMNKYYDKIQKMALDKAIEDYDIEIQYDSDHPNVITFPGSDTKH